MRQTDGEEAVKGYGKLVCRHTLTGAASWAGAGSKDRQQHLGLQQQEHNEELGAGPPCPALVVRDIWAAAVRCPRAERSQ